MRLRILIISFIVLFTSGFGFLSSQSSLETDLEDQQDALDSVFVAYWKAGKISLRSLPLTEETEVINFDAINNRQAEALGLGPHLRKVFDTRLLFDRESADPYTFSVTHIFEFSKEIYHMKDKTEHMDEDDYPTFMEVISHGKRITSGEELQLPNPWNNSLDHWAFALVMEARTLFNSWKTYELERVNVDDIKTSDFRSMAYLHKGVDGFRNEWFYLADKSFTNSIAELNKDKFSLASSVEDLANRHLIDGFTVEQQVKLLLRATSYLMRGWSRQQSESDDLMVKAPEDVELALKDFNQLGIDNELVWLAESYLYIKKEDIERANVSLDKLLSSELISDKEKELIAETKEHLKNRESGKALNFLTDKVFMSRLGASYAYSYADEVEWVVFLKKSEEGREILAKFENFESSINKAKEFLSLEEIKNKSKSFIGDLM